MNDSRTSKPAIFVDRDGTLIEEVNFLSRVEDLKLFPFTAEAVGRIKGSGYLLIVVTNQSGIARGIYSEADMHAIHDAIQESLGGAIDGFYFCPHMPDAGCECRKPGLGMLHKACTDFNIDLGNSWMVGDKALDVKTGVNAGIGAAMVMTGYGRGHVAEIETSSALVGEDLLDIVAQIISLRPSSPILLTEDAL
ncbi:MAG: HAD family hydrolase [Acidobacteriota bacterium]